MKVYYNSSLGSNGDGWRGTQQPVNWHFVHADLPRAIPVIYRFASGIVFDLLTLLDEARLRSWLAAYESQAATLNDQEKRLAAQSHPYQEMLLREVWINDQPVQAGFSASNSISFPWLPEQDRLAEVRRAYAESLPQAACFACERYVIPYPAALSTWQLLGRYLRREKVQSLRLLTHAVARFVPLNITCTLAATEDKQFDFTHPRTGVQHRLHLCAGEVTELPLPSAKLYITTGTYTLEPELPTGDALQFDNTLQYSAEMGHKLVSRATSSIGIIGSADGPTVLFSGGRDTAGRQGELQVHNCLSLPSLQRERVAQFRLEGINMQHLASKEYSFSLS